MKQNKAKKTKKVLKWVAILCILILVVEGGYLLFLSNERKKNELSTDTASQLLKTKDAIYVVGSSDFKNRTLPYTKGEQKAKFAKYSTTGKLLFEKAYTKGYNGIYNDICEVEGGFIAVGHYEKTKQNQKEKTGPGLIVKYSEDGEVLYEKEISILDATTFTKVAPLKDGFLVIGQSIFENMTLGFDEHGGGQMIRFDQDGKEVWRTNYGGSKSGIFNDLYVDEKQDRIYLVGKDATRTGIFMKYRLSDGTMEFVKNYDNTDSVGFSSLAKIGDDFVVGSSKKISEDKDDYKTRALLVRYNQEGKIIFEKQYTNHEMSRFNSLFVQNNEIYAVGHSAILNQEKTTKAVRSFDYSGIYYHLDENGKVLDKKEYKEKNAAIYFSNIIKQKGNMLVVGQSNAKLFGANQRDMQSFLIEMKQTGKKEKQVF